VRFHLIRENIMTHPTLGKYELLEKLGEGATSEVYRARDTALGREVALKVLKPALVADATAFQRFNHESKATAGMTHTYIASVLDVGESDGRYFIAMRYIPGQSLDKILEARGSLTWAETLRLAMQIGSALDHAHQKGFLHRDVKPGNIIRTSKGDFVLTDFGLTRAMMTTSHATHTGAVLGTPAYIAPEIWNGQAASPASDQYALACLIYEVLTGRVLFAGDTPPAVMTRHVLKGPQFPKTWPPGLPPGVEKVLRKALAKNPRERYESVGAFSKALQSLKAVTPQKLSGVGVLAGGVGLIGLALLAGYWLWSNPAWQMPTNSVMAQPSMTPLSTDTSAPLPAYPDLVVTDITLAAFSGDCISAPFSATYNVTIHNQGQADAGNFAVDILGNIQTVSELRAGQSTTISGINAIGGSTISLDVYYQVIESNEGNNVFAGSIPASTPPPMCTPTSPPTNTPLPTYTLYPTLKPLPTYTLFPTLSPTPVPPTPIPPTPIPAAGPNLLGNAGFENGGAREFLNWNFLPNNSSCSRAQHENIWPYARTGARFLSTGRSPDYPNCASVYQDVNVVPQVGQTYTAGFWLRNGGNGSQSQDTGIALWGNGPNPEPARNSVMVTDGKWTCYQLWFTPTRSDNTSLRIEIYLVQTWVMDIQADDLYLGYGAVQYCP
jgi:serine/threonine protein kinase